MRFGTLVFRYLKEKGYYSLINKQQNLSILKHWNDCPIRFLYEIDGIFNKEAMPWGYNGIPQEFIYEWAENNSIHIGDVITVRTQDNKYEFQYKVVLFIFDLDKFYVFTEGGNRIPIFRISLVNGKPVDFENGWGLKKDINDIHKL